MLEGEEGRGKVCVGAGFEEHHDHEKRGGGVGVVNYGGLRVEVGGRGSWSLGESSGAF